MSKEKGAQVLEKLQDVLNEIEKKFENITQMTDWNET